MVLHDFAGTLPIEELWKSSISHPAIAIILSSIVFALALWRSWRFSISPIFYPNDPKELPYWIPIIGHALPFFNNSQQLLTSAREYFGDTREPFTLTVAGSQLHVLTKPKDVGDAYKNTSTFGFDDFVQALMRTFGSSKHCLEAMYSYSQHEPNGNDFPNPHHKPLAKLLRDLHVKQLFPGEHLDDLGSKFVEFFHKSLVLEEVAKKVYATKDTSNSVVVPLHSWTSEIVTTGGQTAYFGPLLEEIDPEMIRTFLEFDELSWQVLYQYPRIVSGRMNVLKDKLIEDLEIYFGMPVEKRVGDAWFTKATEHEARQRAIGTHDLATMMLPLYWAEDLVAHNSNEKAKRLLTYLSVAKQAVVTEVATLLRRFDVELAEPGPFPEMEEGKPVLGIMSNKEGDDPLIRLRKRSTPL